MTTTQQPITLSRAELMHFAMHFHFSRFKDKLILQDFKSIELNLGQDSPYTNFLFLRYFNTPTSPFCLLIIYLMLVLADPGKAKGWSTNTYVIHSLTDSLIN